MQRYTVMKLFVIEYNDLQLETVEGRGTVQTGKQMNVVTVSSISVEQQRCLLSLSKWNTLCTEMKMMTVD